MRFFKLAVALAAILFADSAFAQTLNSGIAQPYLNITAPNTIDGVTLNPTTPAAGGFTSVTSSGNVTLTATGAAVLSKQGTNGQVGTVVASGTTAVSVANTSVATSTAVALSLRTVGGTITGAPYLSTITPGTGFTIKATGAADTSTYNYQLLQNAP